MVATGEHNLTLFAKVFTTRTLVRIVFVLLAAVIMKAASSHDGFSWIAALLPG